MKNKVQLITYADRLGDGTLSSMTDILRTRFDGVYDGVHILPFFTPFDGADAGFDPIDHTKVDPRLGGWDDVAVAVFRVAGVVVGRGGLFDAVNHVYTDTPKSRRASFSEVFLSVDSLRRPMISAHVTLYSPAGNCLR